MTGADREAKVAEGGGVLVCACGAVLEGATDEELLSAVERHVERVHLRLAQVGNDGDPASS